MIFYCDLQGNLKAFQNETVYQGSNNVTTIYVVAPFNRPVGLNISFTKPNKLVTSPAIMKWVGTLGNVKIPVSFVNIPEQFTETYNVWAYALPYSITEQNGVVGVSVNAVIADSVDASGQQAYKGNLTTFTGQFTVAYSALPSPPTDIPTEWTQDKVLDLLNNYYNDAIQKIGEMNTLKTNAKDTLVKAINEVFDEIAATNATIGNLSTLTTDEKTTIVGAINEVDAHADTAQQTAETAQTTADNATTLANNAVATANGAVATANEAKTIAEQAKTIATNSVYSVSFEDIQSAVTALNGYDNAYFKVGNSIYLKQKDVPDMWVYAVASEYIEYTYTTDDDFVNALLLGTVQVGYYVLANLESTGDYDVLKDIPIINQDLSADGFTPVENTYYRHTGTTSETYTAGVIYFYNGTAYKAIDGAGGEVPTSLPATGAKITGELPTSGWNTDTPIYEGKVEIPYNRQGNYQKIIPYDIPQGNVSYEIKTARTQDGIYEERITTGTGSITSGSSLTVYIDWEITVAYISIRTDGIYAHARSSSPTYYLLSIKIAEVAGAVVNYTISDTAIKANSTVSMYLNSADEVRAYSKADGSVVVEMDAVPTVAIPYTLQVVETSAEGAFEIVNSYVPTIPETPTALPQEASALKSGNLPTSGWTDTQGYTYNGNLTLSTTAYTLVKTLSLLEYNTITGSLSNNKIKVQEGSNQYTYSYKSSKNTDDKITIYFGTTRNYAEIYIEKSSKKLYAKSSYSTVTALILLYNTDLTLKQYVISDTDITENSDVLMELTDEGGVKAYSLESGNITVIRDTVPTNPIPYTYKVKQTNASGQFTVINHYTPEFPEVPTTTTLYEDSTGAATVTLSETINNGDIVRIKTNNGNVDHYYIGVAWNRTIAVTESSMVTDESDVTVGTAININSLRFNIQDTSLILFHYFNTNITTAGAVTITNEKTNVVIRKVERIHA